jgi:hypothetical protein
MNLNSNKLVSQGLTIGIGAALCLTSSIAALATTKNINDLETNHNLTENRINNNDPILISQRNFCGQNESMFVAAETKGFWVNICGGDLPNSYVGVSKTDGKSIRLPLNNYDQQGNYFEAVNGNVTYMLIRGTAKGDFLTVTQGNKEIVRQPILNWN